MRSQKLKIAIIFPAHSESLFNKNGPKLVGGANVQMYNLAKRLAQEKELDTYSFIPEYKTIDFEEETCFNFVQTYDEKDFILNRIFKFHRRISSIHPDIIIQHGFTLFSCLLAVYCRLRKIRYVFWFAHDIEVSGCYQGSQKKGVLFRWLLKYSSVLITQNRYQANYLKKHYKRNSFILYNGFFLPQISKVMKEDVLWVARAEKWKRPEVFLDLAEAFPNIHFRMICPSTNDRDYYENIVRKALSIKNLTFHDFVPFNKINDFFAKAKLLVNTSISEGYPQTFIQAVMYGTPILSTGANPDEFITCYSCGVVCNPEQINDQFKEMLRDEEKWQEFSLNARRYAEKQHDINVIIQKLVRIIQ